MEQGARIVCIAALGEDAAESRADQCLEGQELMRKAAAKVAAANLMRAANRIRCKTILCRLFDDEADDVRREAARCFVRLGDGDALAELPDLIKAFMNSKAFPWHAWALFKALDTSTARLPDVVCEVFERVLAQIGSAVQRNERIPEIIPYDSARILLRLYERTSSPEIRSRCLNLVDDMFLYDRGQAEKALMERT